jgi:hypothetical protein
MKLKITGLAVLMAVIVLSSARPSPPQNPSLTPIEFLSSTTAASHTNCNLSVAGQTALCIASDGVWVSTGGAAFAQLAVAGSGVSPVLTVNGTKPGATGNVVITLSAPTVSSTVTSPAVSVTGN